MSFPKKTESEAMDLEYVYEQLVNSKDSHVSLNSPNKAGVYAFFLKKNSPFGMFPSGDAGLVYIGLSNNLAHRGFSQHLTDGATGKSTLRRSIGAILKSELGLISIHRGTGRNERDFINYKFCPESENKLSAWMRKNLLIGIYQTEDYKTIEQQLLSIHAPLMNLVDCDNPYRNKIMELRRMCADEARRNK